MRTHPHFNFEFRLIYITKLILYLDTVPLSIPLDQPIKVMISLNPPSPINLPHLTLSYTKSDVREAYISKRLPLLT